MFCTGLHNEQQGGQNSLRKKFTIISSYALESVAASYTIKNQEFQKGLHKILSKLCNIKRLRANPSHPQGNVWYERMNQIF